MKLLSSILTFLSPFDYPTSRIEALFVRGVSAVGRMRCKILVVVGIEYIQCSRRYMTGDFPGRLEKRNPCDVVHFDV